MDTEERPEDTVRRQARDIRLLNIGIAHRDEQIEQLGDMLTERTTQLLVTSAVCIILLLVLIIGAS